jgi:hypothetical protein
MARPPISGGTTEPVAARQAAGPDKDSIPASGRSKRANSRQQNWKPATAPQHRKQVIELGEGRPRQISREILQEEATMLSEKFILVLETLRSHGPADGSPRVVSTSPHVPIKLPEKTQKT